MMRSAGHLQATPANAGLQLVPCRGTALSIPDAHVPGQREHANMRLGFPSVTVARCTTP
jgi:hypothetical protein